MNTKKTILDQVLNIKKSLSIDDKIIYIQELESKITNQTDYDIIIDLNKKLKNIQHIVDQFLIIEYMAMDCQTEQEISLILYKISELENLLFFNDQDFKDAYMEIKSGSGGIEARDWAYILLKMYIGWGDKNKYQVDIQDIQESEVGINSCVLKFYGDKAFGLLKGESGIHRLVRKSPFCSNNNRHTSFASIYVYPVCDQKDIDIKIRKQELKIDTFRASGAGGQHVNVTDSAVRITHIPTGIVTQSQDGRSQHSNKKKALEQIVSKLEIIKTQEQKNANEQIHGKKANISWGNQIRSYILDKSLIKDLRTKHSRKDIQNVLQGDINDFLNLYIKACYQKKN